MNVKNQVLNRLEKNRGKYLSGEDIAAELGVTRQAVSKAVAALKNEGYLITGINRLGYMLDDECDRLNADIIAERTGVRCFVYESVGSTNTEAEEKFLSGGECIVVSRMQTEGRDKRGGKFYSPPDKGLYFSVAMPFVTDVADIGRLRTVCGRAVAEVISAASGKTAEPLREDEIMCGGKKVAGILIECTLTAATGKTSRAVIGTGIYTCETLFNDGELGWVLTDETRNDLVSEIYLKIKEYTGRR